MKNLFLLGREYFRPADIGDDHTDPFLTNMVNQGFIEAGASGFYDQNGNAIGEGHRH